MTSEQTLTADDNVLKNFTFTGKAGEFFSIWIVNICLTILTLGIYSAWAKVRTNQYFYGNTVLDGASFRYLADPKQILKGRIIAFIIFMLYYFSGMFSPLIAGITLLVIMLLVPALIVLSMAFRLRNSSYRNVRFNFNKDYKQAYKIFALPVLFIGAYVFAASLMQAGNAAVDQVDPDIFVMVGLLALLIAVMFPWWEYMITAFKVKKSCYGDADLKYHARAGNYYVMYLKAVFIPVVAMIVVAFVVGSLAAILAPLAGMDPNQGNQAQAMGAVMPFIIMFFMLPLYAWMFAYIQTKRTNLIYNNITINGHQLRSDLRVGYMTFLYVTNTLAIMVSLGLLIPWAKIRTARYRAAMTSLQPAGDLGSFFNQQQQSQSAYGEEMGEMFDLDIGF
jgi:uncharacterized membrane protein YjgN (DUF898 family)